MTTTTIGPYDADYRTNTPPWERPMLASGIVAGMLYVGSMALFIGLVAPHLPPMDAPAAIHAAFYAEQARSPIYTLIRYLIMAQLAPLPLFYAALFGWLRRAEGSNGGMAVAVLVAGVVTSVITPLVEMIEGHLLLGLAKAGGDAVVTRTFDGMTPVSFALTGFPQAVVLAGTALVLLQVRSVPRAISWCALALAVISLIGTATLVTPSMFFVGTLSSILFKIWMIALSLVLLRSPRTAQ